MSSAMKSLGLKTVPTPGTPVQLSTTSIPCDKVNLEPMKASAAANTGNIYVGLSTMVKATLVGVLYVLAPGQPATTVEPPGGERLELQDDVSNYWIDADTANDGVLVSYV